jgi:hypothetical protein
MRNGNGRDRPKPRANCPGIAQSGAALFSAPAYAVIRVYQQNSIDNLDREVVSMTRTERGPGPPLPDRADITADWLTRALDHGGVIKTATIVDAIGAPVGTGQVADTFRYELTYDVLEPSAPSAVVAKVSAADEGSRSAAIAHRLYEREVRFYQRLAGQVNIRTPRFYYGDIEPATGRFVLVLEDLSPASTVNQLTGFELVHAELAMEQAAGLHAARWDDPGLNDLDWLNHARQHAPAIAQVFPQLTEAFIQRYQDRLEPEWVALIGRLNALTTKFWTDQPGPLTVAHCDFRPDNFLFDAKGGEVPMAVVDWQTINHAPGLIDVSFVLGTSLDTADRRAHEQTLVRRYHDALRAGGVADYSWQRCWDDYRRYASYAIYFLTPAAALVEQTERGDAMFLSMIRRVAAQITDLDTESLLTA